MVEKADETSVRADDVVLAELPPVGSVTLLDRTEVLRELPRKAGVDDRSLGGGWEEKRGFDSAKVS